MKGGVNNFISRSCSRKKKYHNEWDAIYAAEKYDLEYYFCQVCGCWHTTKHKLGKQWEKDYLGGEDGAS